MSQNNKYHKELIDRLKDDTQADIYFYDVLDKCKNSTKKEAQEQLIIAFQNITEAQGGFANLLTNSGAESFYKILSSVILKFVQ